MCAMTSIKKMMMPIIMLVFVAVIISPLAKPNQRRHKFDSEYTLKYKIVLMWSPKPTYHKLAVI